MGLTRTEEVVVEAAHDRLGLSYAEIAAVLGADESSLHRWRKGGRGPASIFSRQIAALGRCLDQMSTVISDDELRTWVTTSWVALDGASPKAALMAGEFDRVALAIRAERELPLRDNDARSSKVELEGDT